MSTTQNLFGKELKEKLQAGIQKLNSAVSSTLGPGGRTVLIKEQSGEVKVTKDGVSVAKAFHKLEDDVEDLGAQLVKQVSIKSANEAGDGTTTSTILATKMVEEGLTLIHQGVNAVAVKKQIDAYIRSKGISWMSDRDNFLDDMFKLYSKDEKTYPVLKNYIQQYLQYQLKRTGIKIIDISLA